MIKLSTFEENIIQRTKQNSSEVLCTMNQVNETINSEKHDLKKNMIELEGCRSKDVEDKNKVVE